MDTPIPTSFRQSHKLLFGVIIAIGILLYTAFNLWVYRSAISSKVLKGDSLPKRSVTFTDTVILATSTPSPRPTGPGSYACSPEGTCNVYNDETRKQYCTTTYADNKCLDQCGTKENQCKK